MKYQAHFESQNVVQKEKTIREMKIKLYMRICQIRSI